MKEGISNIQGAFLCNLSAAWIIRPEWHFVMTATFQPIDSYLIPNKLSSPLNLITFTHFSWVQLFFLHRHLIYNRNLWEVSQAISASISIQWFARNYFLAGMAEGLASLRQLPFAPDLMDMKACLMGQFLLAFQALHPSMLFFEKRNWVPMGKWCFQSCRIGRRSIGFYFMRYTYFSATEWVFRSNCPSISCYTEWFCTLAITPKVWVWESIAGHWLAMARLQNERVRRTIFSMIAMLLLRWSLAEWTTSPSMPCFWTSDQVQQRIMLTNSPVSENKQSLFVWSIYKPVSTQEPESCWRFKLE